MRSENMTQNAGKCPPIANIFAPHRKLARVAQSNDGLLGNSSLCACTIQISPKTTQSDHRDVGWLRNCQLF